MIHLAGLPSLLQTGGEIVQQSQAAIDRFQQQSATIGTTFSLIKLGNDRLAANIREQQTLCCAIVRRSLRTCSEQRFVTVFVAQEASFVFKFKNYSG